MNLEQLKNKSLAEIQGYVEAAEARKAKLLELQKDKKAWTDELQQELVTVVEFLVGVEDVIAEKSKEAKYVPAPGTEQMVHVMLRRGTAKFDKNTGDPIPAYKQLFSFGEWNVFESRATSLGYQIVEVLYNPFKK